jgi:hypothetical protein
MKRNERQLLIFAGTLFVLLLVFRLVPLAWESYRQGRDEIALLEERIDRYRQLLVDTNLWQEREALKAAEMAELEGLVFEGSNPNLIGSAVQRTLRQAMEQSGVSARETPVARYNNAGAWLLVTQELNFTLEQHQILPFLNALQASRPRLHVTAFSVTRNRRQYTGSVTVVGFGKVR